MLEGNLVKKAHQSLQVFIPLSIIRFSLNHVAIQSDSIYSTYRFKKYMHLVWPKSKNNRRTDELS